MFDRLRALKNLFLDVPRQLRLAYCLVRDPRVPVGPKAGVIAALGLAINPVVDLADLIPLVGELDALAVSMLALRVFIALCPSEVVADQERLIAEHRSRFDDDVRAGERLALSVWHRLRPRSEPGIETAWAGGPDAGMELEGAGVARVQWGALA